MEDRKKFWIGVGLILLVLFLLFRGGGAGVQTSQKPVQISQEEGVTVWTEVDCNSIPDCKEKLGLTDKLVDAYDLTCENGVCKVRQTFERGGS